MCLDPISPAYSSAPNFMLSCCCVGAWSGLSQLFVSFRLQRVDEESEKALRGAVEVLITEAFGETERSLTKVSWVQHWHCDAACGVLSACISSVQGSKVSATCEDLVLMMLAGLLLQSGVNLASSGTTASVAFQRGNRLWVAAAGDSRAVLCTRNTHDQWRALPLTIDHRPRRPSERER